MRQSSRYAVFVIVALILARPVAAQMLAGIVVDSVTRRPIAGVRVRAVDTSATGLVLPDATTDSGGVFYLDLGRAGTYKVSFMFGSQGPLSSAIITIGTEDLQRRFVIAPPGDEAYHELQVDTPAKPRPGLALRYPDDLRAQEISGQVILSFVIDTTGRVVEASVKVLHATHSQFVTAVMRGLPDLRYSPAVLRGRRVHQLTQLAFNFCTGAGCPSDRRTGVWIHP